MAVFEEYFPSEKEIIQKYAERQRELEELSKAIRKSENSSKNHRPSLIPRLIPRKPSMSVILSEIHRDTEEKLKQSSDVDSKIEKIHKMIEDVDNINFIMAPDKEISVFDGSGDAGSVLNEIDSEDCEIATSNLVNLDEMPTVIQSTSELIPKRVIRLKQNDSSMELSDYKPPQIKPTKASILKSKFNFEKSQKNLTEIASRKSSAEPHSKIPRIVSHEPSKKVENRKLTKSVRKILDDAKEKHKAKKLVKSNVPVNVLDLFLI